jgi:hypothetical protein
LFTAPSTACRTNRLSWCLASPTNRSSAAIRRAGARPVGLPGFLRARGYAPNRPLAQLSPCEGSSSRFLATNARTSTRVVALWESRTCLGQRALCRSPGARSNRAADAAITLSTPPRERRSCAVAAPCSTGAALPAW